MDSAIVITPIVHLNGNSYTSLIEALEHAYSAVMDATEALRQTAPNGRNYYPEPGRLQRAERQHAERLAHLKAVMDSLQAEAIQLSDETPDALKRR